MVVRQLTEEERYPLSAVQYSMLLHSIAAPAEGLYVQQKVLTLREAIDDRAFERALNDLVARHPVLRTRFDLDAPEGAAQIVQTEACAELARLDWRGTEESLDAFLAEDRRTPFDFAQGPPQRFALIRTGDAEFQFLWTSHHALMDGRSYLILLSELFDCHRARVAGREPVFKERRPFSAYVTWLQEKNASAEFWRERLAGITSPTPIGGDVRAISGNEEPFGEIVQRMPESLSSALTAAAAHCGVTINNFVQAAWSLHLAAVSGREDVLFGIAKSCRASIDGGRDMVGLCINTLPFRTRIDTSMTAGALLQTLRQQQIALRGHEHTPLSRIREWCAVPRHEPLFESVIVFEDFLVDTRLRALGGDWTDRELRLYERSNYPLTLSAYLDGELLLKLAYDRRRYKETDATAIVAAVQGFLIRLAAHPEAALRELLPRADGVIGRTLEYPRDRGVHQLFREQALLRADAPAVVIDGRVMSYGELDRRSSEVAAFLCRNGIGPGALVGIHVDRTFEMMIALLAVHKSGAAYVPMDPAYPRERIAYMIEDAALPMVLTDSRLRDRVPQCGARVVAVDEIVDDRERTAGGPTTAGHAAYVIYTSGSTGRPKGVQVGQRALANLLWSMADSLRFAAGDKFLAVTTICFDIAGLELYLPLITGGTVELVSSRTAADGAALRRQLERSRPAFMQATPATWSMLLRAGWTGDPALTILCGGEALPRDLADELTLRGREVWNLYGPTETTIWSSMSKVERGQRITIGRPIANTQFHLLDEDLQPVARGFPAELFIAGDGVADGYLRRPELTAERFLPCPFGSDGGRMYRTGDLVRLLDDGTVEYLHRVDRQTKLHGFRIEPGEIEYALRQHAAVRDAVVSVREDVPGEPRLVAYMELHQGPQPAEAELRRHLKMTLPDYEVPAAFVPLPSIPRTPNGKIDYAGLPKPSMPVVVPADHDLESRIAAIWSAVLGRDRVALNESFFDAGGNSLLLMETVRRLQDATGRAVTSTEMFAHPTVRSMAAFLAGHGEEHRASGGAVPDAVGELRRKRLALRSGNAVSG